MNLRLRTLLPALLFLLIPVCAFAHPVILITYTVGYRFDANGLQGFTETWWFDKIHSKQILQMFDSNHNGTIDPSELPALQRGYFDDLKDYNFFNSVVVNGRAVPTTKVSDFSARFADDQLIYTFFVPLPIPATSSSQEVDITIWDPTYYTDLTPRGNDAVAIEKPSAIDASVSIANDHRHFYHMAPDVILIKPPPFYLKMMVVTFKRAG
jgi:ABC-type uncharacterized transport system substrate-binding protein